MDFSEFRPLTKTPPLEDIAQPSSGFPKGRRPALIPPEACLTPAEKEDIIRSRLHQPLFPPPDPSLIKRIQEVSPERADSDAGELVNNPLSRIPQLVPCNSGIDGRSTALPRVSIHQVPPTALARDRRRHALWLKAKAHYERDWRARQQQKEDAFAWDSPEPITAFPRLLPESAFLGRHFSGYSSNGFDHPKRKHSAFLLDEELKCQLEDRVGTPHPSGPAPGDDSSERLSVKSLKLEGQREARTGPDGAIGDMLKSCSEKNQTGKDEGLGDDYDAS